MASQAKLTSAACARQMDEKNKKIPRMRPWATGLRRNALKGYDILQSSMIQFLQTVESMSDATVCFRQLCSHAFSKKRGRPEALRPILSDGLPCRAVRREYY
ncbi:hypothetical protein DESC_370162 [Desulfosarcina cetonica]|nr:hypothetical protein DESC_370162 [Desulfosarcina cetonica]